MTIDPVTPPPLLVRASRSGERAQDMLLAPWLPLAQPLEGRMWCDVSTPADASFGQYVDFPAGCDSSQAIEAILNLWKGRVDPVAIWLDGDSPSGEATLHPPSSMTRDGNGKPVAHAVLAEMPVSADRMYRVTGEPGATLLLSDEASHGRTRTIVARDGQVACLRRSQYADPEWTVIPDLGPVGTYWAFADHNAFGAMGAVALHLAEAYDAAPAPDDALVVLAHASLRLRHLGKPYRERVAAILARSPSDDLDVIALTWCLPLDGSGIELLPGRTVELCGMLQSRYPTYKATLDALVARMGRINDMADKPGGRHKEELARACEAVGFLGNLALDGHATVVLGYDF